MVLVNGGWLGLKIVHYSSIEHHHVGHIYIYANTKSNNSNQKLQHGAIQYQVEVGAVIWAKWKVKSNYYRPGETASLAVVTVININWLQSTKHNHCIYLCSHGQYDGKGHNVRVVYLLSLSTLQLHIPKAESPKPLHHSKNQ